MHSRIKNAMLVQPKSTGGNFEYVAIFRQGMLYLSAALRDHQGPYIYDRQIWMEDRSGKIDAARDLDDTDLLLVTALINEAPRAYEVARQAKLTHPHIRSMGGGPHMGPLYEEAIREGLLDVVVMREAEDVVGTVADLLLTYEGDALTRELYKVGGIAFRDGERIVRTPFRPVIPSDYVTLPDYRSVRDLTPQNPLAAGIIETVRGCVENCSFCEVVQQFKGYRMVSRQTELARLQQLQEMAADGLIYRSPINGRFAVFVTDDLHPPPLRAVKFRNERMERVRNWRGRTDGMFMIIQGRAELGQDAEMAEGMRDIGVEMLYLGVESSNAKNLELVRKRQDPDQVHRDLEQLNRYGYTVVAMTIIGLPYDTEESVMELAEWVRSVSRYQTANLLTPLPATINWPNPLMATGLKLLDEDGSLLPEGKLPPYHLYTGRQFVFQDEATLPNGEPRNWTLQRSREIYDKYTARLRPIDKLYERIFRTMKARQAHHPELAVPTRV